MFKKTLTRSLAKAASWRILATLTTGLLVFAFTQRLDIALGVGFLEAIAKLFLYFLHERVWNRLSFGRLAGGAVRVSGTASNSAEPERQPVRRGSATA